MGTRTQEKIQDQKYTCEMICLEVIIKAIRVIEFGERDKERERSGMIRRPRRPRRLKPEDFHL